MEEKSPLNTGDFQYSDLVVPTPTLTPDSLYWEVDDINPNQIIYDLENDEVIIPNEDDFIPAPAPTEQPIIKKIVSRNVGNSRRRRSR